MTKIDENEEPLRVIVHVTDESLAALVESGPFKRTGIPAQLHMNYWLPGDEWGSRQDAYSALAANMGGGIPPDVIRENSDCPP